MPDLSTRLDQAIQAAKGGKRVRARDRFLDIVEQDPNNLQAWIWLSRLVDDPHDQITALENALALVQGNTEQQRVIESRLGDLRDANPACVERVVEPLAREKLDLKCQKAEELLHLQLRSEALDLLQSVVETDPGHQQAWLLLSEFHPDPARQAEALKKVLMIDYKNEAAWERLVILSQAQNEPFKRGRWLEERGQFERAAKVYLSVITHSRSPLERRQAQQRIDQIKLQQEAEAIQPVNANLNLARLVSGPVMLFAFMIFIQSGLNPLHISLLACPAVLSVLTGSLMLSATDLRPVHPLWTRLFGAPGAGDEPEWRRGMRMLGWALMLAPFTMFLIEASYRLGVLQASMMGR